MKEQAVRKINKIGRISSVIALVGKILVSVGIGVLLLTSIVCFMMPEDSIRYESTEKVIMEMDYRKLKLQIEEEEIREQVELSIGNLLINSNNGLKEVKIVDNMINITQEGQQFSMDIHDVAGMTFILAIMLIVVMITLIYAGGLCKAFRDCQSPFEENVIKKMHHFAFSLIPWTVASSTIRTISSGYRISVSVDVGMVLVVLVVFLLVYIFKYGAILQRESDETL